MGHAFSHQQWNQNPNAAGSAGGGGYLGLENYAQNVGLGKAGKTAKGILNQMSSGDYGNLAGTILSPIHDRYATQLRELTRNNQMGANAMYQGTQPALMAGLEDETRRQMAEGEGLAYGQAIPQLYGQASGTYQGALNQQENQQLGALDAATRARLGSGQYNTQPGWFDRVGQVAGTAAQIGGMAMGIPAMGGPGMGAGNSTWNPGNPGICWVAGELFGEGGIEQMLIRNYLLNHSSLLVKAFTTLYRIIGRRWAALIRSNKVLRHHTQILFDLILDRANSSGRRPL